jgi:hypothetical protein
MHGRPWKALVLAVLGLALCAAGAQASSEPGPKPGAMSGLVKVKGEAGGKKSSSPNLLYHGGPVMTNGAAVTAIFWGTTWTSSDPKVAGMSSFYSGVGGTSYLGTNTEYTDSSGGHVSSAVSYAGSLVDPSAAPRGAPKESDILAEVGKLVPSPVANGYYPVYVDTPRGHTRYCAWHSTGTVNGVTVRFGFFFNLDGDPGCDPESPVTAYSQGVAALGNVSGHELSEMLTDPNLNAWYDASGAENSDKCAWTFGSKLIQFKNRTQWKIQGNWSNAAYDANTGYTDPSAGFVPGCIDGTN